MPAATDPVLGDIAVIAASQLFDERWYLEHYPDVAASGADPVEHYVRHGAAEGRDPGATFQTAFYLRNNPDVAASGINPLRHYIEFGQTEGRRPLALDAAPPPPGDRSSDVEVLARSGLFDREAYLQRHPRVARAGADPVAHYLEQDVAEAPCALFDAAYYLKKNPDVATSGMDPFLHFCKFGWKQLRNPGPDFDMAWYWLKHLAECQPDTNPLAHCLAKGREEGLEIRAAGQLSPDDKDALSVVSARLLRREDHGIAMADRIGRAALRLGSWSDAEAAFRIVVSLARDDAGAHNRLAIALEKQGRWWQAVEALKTATALDATHAVWFYRLGEAEENMNRFALAAAAFQRAIDLDAQYPLWHYRVGYAHEQSGDAQKAHAAYSEAIRLDGSEELRRFGVGFFHQQYGYWHEAATAFAEKLINAPHDAELQYRLGMAHDRCYRWAQAEDAYRKAIALKPDEPYWHYRHGFVMARQEKWLDAADAYAAAAALSAKPVPYWHYRRGYVLAKAGKHEEACLSYIRTYEQQVPSSRTGDAAHTVRSIDAVAKLFCRGKPPDEETVSRLIAGDTSNAHLHHLLGATRERRGDWTGAAEAYANAVARSNPHPPAWYYRLGTMLFRAGRYVEACDAFSDVRVFKLPYGVDTGSYSKNPDVHSNMQYREMLDTLAVREKTVLYESTHGASMGGNPYALFEYLRSRPEYRDWTHVWAIAAGAPIPEHIRSRANVILAEYDSHLYRRYLATASYLINDSTFPYWFSRRPQQKYLNTWHGTPLKTLGRAIRGDDEFLAHRNIQRNLLHATHLISPNPHTTEVLLDDFDIRHIRTAKLAETGYPRIDRTLDASPERVAHVRQLLGLKEGVPVALYAPTWRGIFGHPELDVTRLRDDLVKLSALPCQWIFRGHAFSESLLRGADLPVAIAPPELDTADVLAVTDLLVTDYSSIFFDFLPTRRPVFYYCYDLDQYAKQRGLYFDMQEMPGPVCRDVDALNAAIARALAGDAEDRKAYCAAIARFCPHEDGDATARTAAFFFDDDDRHVIPGSRGEKPSLLFFGGHFPPNGINASFLNLMSALDESGKYHLTVAVEPQRIHNEPVWLERFRRLPRGIAVTPKTGRMVVNAEQNWIAGRFRQQRQFRSPEMREIFRTAYRHEFRRCFGDSKFDVLVDFDGYNPYWTTLFGMGCEDTRTICWLHSDFYEEYKLKHPYLISQFAIYPDYDALVSVSGSMAGVNRQKLAGRFGIDPAKFLHCSNIVHGDEIRELAQQPLEPDFGPWLRDTTTFLTLGRLSAEKDHAKLIDAFARLHSRHPETRLLMVGEGPLRTALERQIDRLGLERAVYLAGLRSNPFPLLSKCDCFVLSSNHEGQPMVLLEAMILRRPIVATDIDGSRAVLKGGHGHLVPNSASGLEQGMLDFLHGKLAFEPFDAEAYREEALRSFDSVVGVRAAMARNN